MTVLVTGGTGFIGINIVGCLARRGEDVVALDASPPDQSPQSLLRHFPDRVSIIRGDVRDLALLQQLAADHNVDRIVHAAAITPADTEWERDHCQAIVEVNLLGTVNVFQLARSLSSLHRVIYISSGAVYGSMQAQGPVTEDHPVAPQGLYAITKYASELVGHRWRQLFDLDIASVRLSEVYGPMQRITPSSQRMSSIYTLVRLAVQGKPIKINSLEERRDYVHVWDVARGIVDLLQAPSLAHEIYNISEGVAYSMDEVLEALAGCVPEMSYSVVTQEEANVWVDPGRQEEPMDNTRLRAELNFELQYSLTEGLKQYVHWLSEGNP